MNRFHRFFISIGLILAGLPGPTLTVQAAPIDQTTPPPVEPRFGVVEAYDRPEDATELGVGWERITFDWSRIQPTPDSWVEWPISDAVLDAEQASGRELVGLIINTPEWAADPERGRNVPRGLELPPDDPQNLWAGFIRSLVTRHADRIKHWIIWNEPDIWDTGNQTWGGSIEEFARLQKVAYLTAHQTDSGAVVHLAAVTHWWDVNYQREPYLRRLLRVIAEDPEAAANHYYLDAITLHIYFNADTVYDVSRYYQDLFKPYRFMPELWVAETNAPPSDDPLWPVPEAAFTITQEDQANFVLQSFALSLAAGADRVSIYKMGDHGGQGVNPEPFGLIREDGSRRPAFTAYQTAARYLAGFESATLKRRDSAAVVLVERGSKRRTTVVWARTPRSVRISLPARSRQAIWVDAAGQIQSVTPTRGQYTLTLPGSPCHHPGTTGPCLIGGPVYLLVEGETPAVTIAVGKNP